jgi:hypothetical protein
LCLWDYEGRLKVGDRLILAAFGGGFTWAGAYLTWAYAAGRPAAGEGTGAGAKMTSTATLEEAEV